MNDWAPKRFWQSTQITRTEGGFAVMLDARPLRTPGKAEFVVPTETMAWAVAAEWEAQEEAIQPQTMPLTRAANSAIDTVRPNREAVVDTIVGYGETDLLCYRASMPRELQRRQTGAWDPMIDWAERRFGARLTVVEGVMFAPQPRASLAALRGQLAGFGPFGLTGLHDLVTLSGSLVLGLAAATGHSPAAALWDVSRIDEDWQQEQWGIDDEAAEAAANKRRAFLEAHRLMELCAALAGN